MKTYNDLIIRDKLTANPVRPIVVVHGFGYDPNSSGKDNPGETFVPLFQGMFPDREVKGFYYYSVPPGVGGVVRSWLHGRWNRYRYAWDLAGEAGISLRKDLFYFGRQGGCDVIAHSLGSRVVASAFDSPEPLPVRRVLLLNGAEHISTYKRVLERPGTRNTEFMNVCVKTDDVLRIMGGLFSPGRIYERCVGQVGLGRYAPNRWIDMPLDDPEVATWGLWQGWLLRGDNPHHLGDHWYSFKFLGNRPLYKAWLNDKLLIS